MSENKSFDETIIKANLNELAHTFVRELGLACRKVAIYGRQHPMAQRAIEKPFFALDKIFRFRNHANLNRYQGELYALNIALKPSVFTDEIDSYMKVFEAEAILFNRKVTIHELGAFIGHFVKKVALSDYENLLHTYLEKNNITSIEVNTARAFKFFESQRKYRGNVLGDYSVKHLVEEQLGNTIELLIDINTSGQEALDARGIDFTLEVVNSVIPEKFAAFSKGAVIKTLTNLIDLLHQQQSRSQQETLMRTYKSLYSLVDYHPQRDAIVADLEEYLSAHKLPPDITKELSSPVGAIRVASIEQIDDILGDFFSSERKYTLDDFCQAFQRLLKTGQREKAADIMDAMLGKLASPEREARQNALQLLVCSIGLMNHVTDRYVVESMIRLITADLSRHVETYEYSEVIWKLAEWCLAARHFELLAELMAALAQQRHFEGEVTVYDSMAVKKVYEYINRREIIDDLINNMIKADYETSRHIRRVLVALGSEEVAAALAEIISHPIRQVRQQALKVLAELGKASLNVFSRILFDDTMFEREGNRLELPDSKWYIIRNSIFVLGSLGDPAGIVPLRLRFDDSDVRVRREIISALEKIGGEDACDMLVLMADDSVKEIRERAVQAVGAIGTPDIVPQLIDLIRRNPAVALRSIQALGRIGGDEARTFLSDLLKNDAELAALASGKTSKEELRVAIIQALGRIGDKKAIETIKGYKENLSASQKLFFKKSPVNKVISEILSRH